MIEWKTLKAIILAAGPGKRLRPLTHTGPKHLLPVAGKPVIQYAINALRNAGIQNIGVVVGYMKEHIIDYLQDGSDFNAKITYIEQAKQKGIAHAIRCAKDYVADEPFLAYLGDNLIRDDLKAYIGNFSKRQADAMILLAKIPDPERFGVAVVKENKIVRLVEKPKQHISDLALVGVYFLRPIIFEAIDSITPSWRGELEITDAIQYLIEKGHRVDYRIISGWWADSGRPEDLIEVNYLVLDELQSEIKGTVEKGASLYGRIHIGENTVIRSGTQIRGPVYIGKKCEIKPNTYVGPYTSIEDDVIIKGGEIENSMVFSGCHIEIEGESRIVSSIIGSNSVVTQQKQIKPKGIKIVVGENARITL